MSTHARNTYPATSHAAANEDRTAQRLTVLRVLYDTAEGTSSEIDKYLGCSHGTYWRRCSDLLRMKLIYDMGFTRTGVFPGCREQRVYGLTSAGIKFVQAHMKVV